MNAFRCDLCGCGRSMPMSAWVVRCLDCGLAMTYPVPREEELQKRYESDYYTGWTGEGVRARLWRRRLDIVRRFLPAGAILDVGCGAGEFLRAAKAAGYQVAGTEFSAAARESIRDFPIYRSPAEAQGKYDAATLWHVLEHTLSPSAMLQQVRERLLPGGRLFIAVPNVKSFWFNGVYRLVKGKWPGLYTPETKEPHLIHFSAETLRKFLVKSGFSVIYESCDVPDTDWRYRLADFPARALYRVLPINWTTTLLTVSIFTGST